MPENQINIPQRGSDDSKPAVISTEIREHFSGPLPHPNILAQYDKIVRGAADRIIKKFESQTEHRQKIEKIVIWTDSIKSLIGVLFGFIIAMTAILGGIYTSLQGKSFLGAGLSFTGLALLVGAFVANKYWKQKN